MSEASRATGRPSNRGRVGTVVNGKWTIDARIGSGGMATVYAATHRNGRRVAIKMLHTPLSRDEATRARFLREGYVANAVGHPGVVHVTDDGVTEDGAAFLVLDLLEGDTVEEHRNRGGGAMSVDEVLDMADQALDALGAAHEKGIVHRDLKPENVFLCTSGDVKLLDFGLAQMKSTQSESTKTGVTIGTPAFMSPEQARRTREGVDARSDVWGFGATMFTALTGTFVHDAETLQEQLMANATLRARSVRELAPHVPASVAIVIDRALELDKRDRWENAREMQRALRAARAPRSDSEGFLLDSLTLPAASMRHEPHADPEPASGPRSSSLSRPIVPSSGKTLLTSPPSSDPTIKEKAPETEVDPMMLLDSLPSSDGPFTPKPITAPLTGSRASGAGLQAESHRQLAMRAQADKVGQIGQPRPDRSFGNAFTPTSTPIIASHAPAPTLASSTGSGPYAALNSEPGYSGVGPQSYRTSHPSAVPPGPAYGPSHPSAAPHPSGPPSVAPGPVSLRQRRSARVVVTISVLLIILSASWAAWVLLHR